MLFVLVVVAGVVEVGSWGDVGVVDVNVRRQDTQCFEITKSRRHPLLLVMVPCPIGVAWCPAFCTDIDSADKPRLLLAWQQLSGQRQGPDIGLSIDDVCAAAGKTSCRFSFGFNFQRQHI